MNKSLLCCGFWISHFHNKIRSGTPAHTGEPFRLWTSYGILSVIESLILITGFATLVAVCFIDATTGYLPNMFTYTICIVDCVVNVLELGIFSLGLQAVYAIFWLTNKCYLTLTGKEGIGKGRCQVISRHPRLGRSIFNTSNFVDCKCKCDRLVFCNS